MRKVEFHGITLLIECEYEPAQHGGMTDPSWEAYYSIEKVWQKSKNDETIFDVTDLVQELDPDFFDSLNEALLNEDSEKKFNHEIEKKENSIYYSIFEAMGIAYKGIPDIKK